MKVYELQELLNKVKNKEAEVYMNYEMSINCPVESGDIYIDESGKETLELYE